MSTSAALSFCRCWFGKEAGDLVDYIYQGPVMLVLLVRPLWINGLGHKEQNKRST